MNEDWRAGFAPAYFFVCDRRISHLPTTLLLLFAKTPARRTGFGCKHPQGGAPSLPTFCELHGRDAHLPKDAVIFSGHQRKRPFSERMARICAVQAP